MIGRLFLAAGAALLAGASLAQDVARDPQLPPIASPLPPPPDRTPRAAVMLADYRYDDLLWENARTAHRT